tara:strand:+ start:6632 stop:7162 length:531 start_codon:yes stop_codon:yes gene_type:complete
LYVDGDKRAYSPSGSLANDTWSHIGFSHDTSLGSENQKLFVNGEQVATGTYTTSMGSETTGIQIGYSARVSGRCFQGKIDDVRMWTHRALTAPEARAIFDNSKDTYLGVLNRWTSTYSKAAAAAADVVVRAPFYLDAEDSYAAGVDVGQPHMAGDEAEAFYAGGAEAAGVVPEGHN